MHLFVYVCVYIDTHIHKHMLDDVTHRQQYDSVVNLKEMKKKSYSKIHARWWDIFSGHFYNAHKVIFLQHNIQWIFGYNNLVKQPQISFWRFFISFGFSKRYAQLMEVWNHAFCLIFYWVTSHVLSAYYVQGTH